MKTTDNLKLNLYEPTDLADLTDGYNGSMEILDTNLYTAQTDITNLTNDLGTKAPTAHASSARTYGVGTINQFGHLKISDNINNDYTAAAGVALSSSAFILNKSNEFNPDSDISTIGGIIKPSEVGLNIVHNKTGEVFKFYGNCVWPNEDSPFTISDYTVGAVFKNANNFPPSNDYSIGAAGIGYIKYNDGTSDVRDSYLTIYKNGDIGCFVYADKSKTISRIWLSYTPSLYFNYDLGDK